MATARRKDPYLSFRFRIEIDGIISGGFAECSGLQVETETEEYREGGVNDYVHKLPKVTKYPNLTLKRGITDSEELWEWYQDVVMGRIQRKNGSIILLNSEGNETWRWNFKGAYPVKWTGPDLKSDSNAVAFETLELIHTGMTK
jgi:phage tail-like protein